MDSSPATSYSYDELGRVDRMAPAALGNPLPAEAQNLNFDSTNQVTQSDDDNGTQQESFSYDANGNRLGTTDPYNQLREDAFHRYDYDAEGNVDGKWFLKQAGTFSVTIDDHNDSGLTDPSGNPIYAPVIAAQSATQPVQEDRWYRVRVRPLKISSSQTPNTVAVTVKLRANGDDIYSTTQTLNVNAGYTDAFLGTLLPG